MESVASPSCSQKQELSQMLDTRDGIDIISNLEGNVLHYILSFLPTKDAVRTSILSRRWQYIWTSMSDINLDDTYDATWKARKSKDRPSFLEFVDRVFLLHDASDIKSLLLHLSEPVTSSRFNSWIRTAMKHNLQYLDAFFPPVRTPFSFSCFLFTCESLRVLKLEMDCALKPPTFVHLPHLKTLHLHLVTFVDDDSTERLFSGCPVLEELELMDCGWKNIRNVKITIPTVKKLKIEHTKMHEEVLSGVINIHAANLIYLNCFTYITVDFHLHDLCSLVDATMESMTIKLNQDDCVRRVFNSVASTYNAKSFATLEDTLCYLADTENLLDHLPTFHNMTDLTLTTEFYGSEMSSQALMDLLEKSPKLKCITFDEGFSRHSTFEESYFLERVPFCIENSLERCIISAFIGHPAEIHMLRYFLKNAKKLEKITLYSDHSSDKMLEERLNNQLEVLRKDCIIEWL